MAQVRVWMGSERVWQRMWLVVGLRGSVGDALVGLWRWVAAAHGGGAQWWLASCGRPCPRNAHMANGWGR